MCWRRATPARYGERRARAGATVTDEQVADIQSRLKARETPQPRFCWHCRKPLHARTDRCPFCNEAQS